VYKPDRALELLRIGSRDQQAQFRESQEAAIKEIIDGSKRVLVVHKTGWGKVSCTSSRPSYCANPAQGRSCWFLRFFLL
jgi:hypothetical protein